MKCSTDCRIINLFIMRILKNPSLRSWLLLLFTSTLVFCTALAANYQEQKTVNIYISMSGSDSNTGSFEKPFRSLIAVQKYIDSLHEKSNINIYFRKGDYYILDSFILSEKNLPEGSSILLSGYKDEVVNISGARRLDNSKFKLVAESSVSTRLSKKAIGNVYQYDLSDLTNSDFGIIMPNGFGRKKTPSAMELFSNNEPMTLARWPNDSSLLSIKNVIEQDSSLQPSGKADKKYPIFQYSSNVNKDWKDSSDIWVAGYFSAGWAFENLPVKSIDQSSNKVSLNDFAHYGVNSSSDASTSVLKAAQSIRGFYFYNVLEELDEPGEWYLDKKTKQLYIWPKSSIEQEKFEVSILKNPLLSFSATGGITLINLNFKCVRDKFVSAVNMKNVLIKNCDFVNSGTEGIIFNKSTNITIEDCIFKNTGTSSIILEGGNRKMLQSGNNIIRNCEVSNYSRISRSATPGISLDGVGAIVDHCYLHDAPNQAIIYKGNDHIIRNNYISGVCRDYYDMGAVYTGRDPSSTGTIIENNYFYQIRSKRGAVAAVYVDDGSGGIRVKNNLFVESGGNSSTSLGAVHVHGGSNNFFENNIFIQCKKAYSNTPWSNEKWKSMYISNPQNKKMLLGNANILSNLYLTKYPYLKDFFTDGATLKERINYINNTVCYKVEVFSSGSGYKITNTLISNSDPSFSSLNNANILKITPSKEVDQWKGWSPINFANIRRPN